MDKAIRISRTAAGGYYAAEGRLECWGEIAERMDGTVGLTCDGTMILPRAAEETARQVMADGIERTYMPEPVAAPVNDVPRSTMPLCPKCGTVCYGDCE